jgi:uncharacterized circularly permuted ATP-grasp superfamily protein
LARWVKDSDLLSLLGEMGVTVNFWHVADAGKDSVDLLDRLVNTYGPGPNYIVVRNLGRGSDFSQLDESAALKKALAMGGCVITLAAAARGQHAQDRPPERQLLGRHPQQDRPGCPGHAGAPARQDLERAERSLAAVPGHFDELRGRTAMGAGEQPSAAQSIAQSSTMTRAWSQFFESCSSDGLGPLGQRSTSLARQIRDNGVTYNVYADEGGPQRPWSLDLFPLILSPQSWQQIETGVKQRVRVLDHVMADVYGEQQLLKLGLLPPALVQGHPGYLRPMHGVKPVGGTHLHIAAFDLARGPDGNWWVISQRTQAPSGLGYLLENRLAVSRLFPQAFDTLQVQRLAGTYRALMDSIKQMSPAGNDAHIALLTPGPYNETYFEHAYLARYLGLTLVEGSDLIVRDQHLYLKTLKGLDAGACPAQAAGRPVSGPAGAAGRLHAGRARAAAGIRAGNVLVANAPGSAFLESPALLGFLPALVQAPAGRRTAAARTAHLVVRRALGDGRGAAAPA